MLRNPLTWLLLFVVSTALAACCGSVACDCRDNLDDAIAFRFNTNTTTPQGFRPEELDTVYIRRVPLDTAQRPRADTVLLTGGRSLFVSSFLINNGTPFGQSGTRKLDQYTYKIYLGRRRAPKDSFVLKDIQIEDRFAGDGCCTCNLNTRKDLRVDGQYFNLTDPNGNDRLDTLILNRQF